MHTPRYRSWKMNQMNDLNIPVDPPESWQAKVSRLVKTVFLPYAVPYIIPVFLAWKYTRQRDDSGDERVASLRAEVVQLRKRLNSSQDRLRGTERREQRKLTEINRELEEIRRMLLERQDIFCSQFRWRESREKVEEALLDFAYERSYEKDLRLYRGMEDILANDKHCGRNREENGCLMWVYMDLWKTQIQLKAQENILNEMKR